MSITTLSLLLILLICFSRALTAPVFGVVGYLSVYTVYNPGIWFGQQLTSILFRPSLLAAAVFIIGCLVNANKLNWNFSRRELEMYLFVASAFMVSYFFGIGVEEDNWEYLEKLLKISVFLFFLFRSVHTFSHYKIVVWTLITGAFFIAIQAHLIGSYDSGRLNNVGGTDFGEANAFAAFMVVNILLLGFKLFKRNWWTKILMIVPIAVMLNAMLMTQSRAVFLGMVFCAVFVFFQSPKKIRKELWGYLLLAVVMFTMLAHDQFWERMETIDSQSKLLTQETLSWDSSQMPLSRIDFWKSSIQIFKDHPMGIGVKNFQKIVPFYDYRNPGRDAHNTFVLCYSEIGVIGIILFFLIIFKALIQLRRIYRFESQNENRFEIHIAAFSLMAVLVMLLTGPMMTHSYLYSEFTWIILSLPICLENALRHQILAQTSIETLN